MKLTITDLIVKKVDGVITVSCAIVEWNGVGDFEFKIGEMSIVSDDSEIETENFGEFSKGVVKNVVGQGNGVSNKGIATLYDDRLCTDDIHNHRMANTDDIWHCVNCGLMKDV